MKKQIVKLSFAALLSISILSCESDDNGPSAKDILANKKTEFVQNYADIVLASYEDSYAKAKDLKTAIDAFVAAPTQAGLETAKQAWLDAREPYGQTEAYRFYDGPIDGNDGEPEGYINAWPLDEALIDYVQAGTGGDTTQAGFNIVNNIKDYPTITAKALREANGLNGGESNVAIGYHGIEFLLWGQDLTAESELKAGLRPFTDYSTADNADRRGAYLKIAVDVLIEDLAGVLNEWKEKGDYRATFLAQGKDAAINDILTGLAKLSKGELAGERMAVAVENHSQEDEHSCFSDNTHRDVYLNAQSINNVLNGSYTRVDGSKVEGTSLLEIATLVDAEKAVKLKAVAVESMTKVKVISDTKFFDNQIMKESLTDTDKPVVSAIGTLRRQGDRIAEVGEAITGITIDPSV